MPRLMAAYVVLWATVLLLANATPVVWDNGAMDNSFSVAMNWVGDVLPTGTDTAQVALNGADKCVIASGDAPSGVGLTVTTGEVSASGDNDFGAVSTAGTLTLDGSTAGMSIASLSVIGGTFTHENTGDVDFGGTLSLTAGTVNINADVTGNQNVNINGAAVAIAHTGKESGAMSVDFGTVSLNSGSLGLSCTSDDLNLAAAVSTSTASGLTLTTGGGCTVNLDSLSLGQTTSITGSMSVSGTLTSSAGSSTISGTLGTTDVDVTGGSLSSSGSWTTSGTIDVTGAGDLKLTGNTLDMQGSSTLTAAATLTQIAGDLDLTGASSHVDVTGTLARSGSGAIDITGADAYMRFNGATLTSSSTGTVTLNAANAYLEFLGATSGTFGPLTVSDGNEAATGCIRVGGTSDITLANLNLNGGCHLVASAGTHVRTSGSSSLNNGNAILTSADWTSTGTLTVDSGDSIAVNGGGFTSATTIVDGTITLTNGTPSSAETIEVNGALNVDNTPFSLTSASTVSLVEGTATFTNGATLAHSYHLKIDKAGAMTITGGDLTSSYSGSPAVEITGNTGGGEADSYLLLSGSNWATTEDTELTATCSGCAVELRMESSSILTSSNVLDFSFYNQGKWRVSSSSVSVTNSASSLHMDHNAELHVTSSNFDWAGTASFDSNSHLFLTTMGSATFDGLLTWDSSQNIEVDGTSTLHLRGGLETEGATTVNVQGDMHIYDTIDLNGDLTHNSGGLITLHAITTYNIAGTSTDVAVGTDSEIRFENTTISFVDNKFQNHWDLNSATSYLGVHGSGSVWTISHSDVDGTSELTTGNDGEIHVEDGATFKTTVPFTVDGARLVIENNGVAMHTSDLTVSNNKYYIVRSGATSTVSKFDVYGYVYINAGDVEVNGQFFIDDNTNGRVTVRGGGTLNITGAFHIDGSGADLLVESGAVVRLSSDAASFTFDSNADIDITGANSKFILERPAASITQNGGDFDVHDAGTLEIRSNNLLMGNNWHLHADSGGEILITGSGIEIADNANFDVTGGDLRVSNNGDLRLTDSELKFDSAELTVDAGSEAVIDTDTADWIEGGLTVGGTVIFEGQTEVFISNGTTWTILPGGRIIFRNSTSLTWESATFFTDVFSNIEWNSNNSYTPPPGSDVVINSNQTFSAGELVIADDGTLTVTGTGTIKAQNTWQLSVIRNSKLLLDGGSIRFDDSTAMHLGLSNFTMTSGTFRGLGSSAHSLHNSTLSVSGAMSFLQMATLDTTGSLIAVDSGLTFGGTSVTNFGTTSLEVNGGNVDVGGSCNVTATDSAVMITSGSFSTSSGGAFLASDSNVTVVGNVIANGKSTFSADSMSVVNVQGSGSIEVSQNGTASFSASLLTVAGSLSVGGDGNVLFDNGAIATIPSGSFDMANESSAVVSTNACVHLLNGGLLDLSGNAKFALEQGGCINVTWTGVPGTEGAITARSMSQLITRTAGTIYLTGGDLTVGPDATLLQENRGIVNVDLGTLTSRGTFTSSQNSTMSITNGNVALYDSSVTTVSLDSTVTVAGDVRLFNTSELQVNSQGRVLVSGAGTLTFTAQSTLTGAGGVVDVQTGDVRFEDNSGGLGNVDLSVGTGSFLVLNNSHPQFSNALIQATGAGGNIQVLHNAVLELHDSDVTITDGQLLLDNSGLLSSVDSRYLVRGLVQLSESARAIFSGGSFDATALGGQKGDVRVLDDATWVSNNVNMTINNGTFSGASFGNITLVDADVNVLLGSFVLSNQATGSISGGSLTTSGGSVVSSDNSTLFATNSALTTVASGLLHIKDDGSYQSVGAHLLVAGGNALFSDDSASTVEAGSFNTTDGDVTVRDIASLTLSNLAIADVKNGSVNVRNDAQLDNQNAEVLITGGTLNSFHNATISATLAGSITVRAGSVVISDRSSAVLTKNAILAVEDGSILFKNSGSLVSSNSSTLVTGGSANFTDNSTALVTGGTFVTSGVGVLTGDVFALDDSVLTFVSANVLAQDGSIVVQDDASIVGRFGLFETDGGDLIVENQGTYKTNQTDTLVSTGTAEFRDSARADIYQGSFGTAGGNILANNVALLQFDQSTITVSTGNLDLAQNATIRGYSSAFNVSAGTATFSDTTNIVLNAGTFETTGGSVVIRDSAIFNTSTTDTLVRGGSATFRDDSVGYISQGSFGSSGIGVVTGDILVRDNAVIYFTDADVTVADGTLTLTHKSRIEGVDADFDVSGGDAHFHGNSTVKLLRGTYGTSGGNVVVGFSATLNATEVQMDVSDGQLLLDDDAAFLSTDTTIDVSGGQAEFRGDSSTHLLRGYLNATGAMMSTGQILIHERAFVDLLSTTVAVTDGNLIASGRSNLDALQTDFVISSGSSVFEGNGTVGITTSTINVNGGDMFIQEHTTLTTVDVDIDVSDGEIRFDNQASFVANNTRTTVSGGDANFQGNSTSAVTGGFLTATGVGMISGDVTISEHADVKFFTTSVSVTHGTLTTTGSATVLSQDSGILVSNGTATLTSSSFVDVLRGEIRVTGGDLVAQGASRLDTKNTNITVTDGQLVFKGGADFNALSTRTVVSGGSAIFEGSSVSVLSNGTLEATGDMVNTGNVIMRQNAQVQFLKNSVDVTDGVLSGLGHSIASSVDSEISVSLGLASFDGNSTLDMLRGRFTANGGNVLVTGNADLKTKFTDVTVNGGDFAFDGMGQYLATNTTTVVQNGEAVFGGSSDSFIKGGTFTLTGGNVTTTESGRVTFEDSVVTVNLVSLGLFHSHNSSDVVGIDTDFIINDGDVIVSGNATIDLLRGTFLTAGGNVIVGGDVGLLKTNNVDVDVRNGSLAFTELGGYSALNSRTGVRGGNALFLQGSVSIVNGGSFNVSGGNVEVNHKATVTFTNFVTLDVTSGLLTTDGNSTAFGVDADITVRGGSAIFQGDSTLDTTRGLFTTLGGNVLVRGDARFASSATAITVSNGNVLFSENGVFDATGSMTVVEGGTARFTDTSETYVNGGYFNTSGTGMTAGDVTADKRAFLEFTSAALGVSDGSLTVTNMARIELDETSVEVSGGNVVMSGNSTMNGIGSSLLVSGLDPDMLIADYAAINFFNSTAEVNGGTLRLENFGKLNGTQSIVRVASGNFTARHHSLVLIDKGSLEVTGGGAYFHDNATLQVLHKDSVINVAGGSLVFQDNVNVLLDPEVSVIVAGSLTVRDVVTSTMDSVVFEIDGSVLFEDDMSWTFDSNSLITLRGTLDMTDRAELLLFGSSDWQITSGRFNGIDSITLGMDFSSMTVNGSFYIQDNHTLTMTGGSALTISSGVASFNGTMYATDEIFNSVITVENGNMLWFQDLRPVMRHSDLVVSGGDLSFRDTVELLFQGSSLTVSDGNALFSDDVVVTIEPTFQRPSWDNEGGDVIVSDNVVMTIVNIDMSVSNGSVVFQDVSQARFVTGHADIVGGSFVLTHNAEVHTHTLLLDIRGGDMVLRNTSLLSTNITATRITDGNFIGQDNSSATLLTSSLKVEGGNVQLSEQFVVDLTSSSLILSLGSINQNHWSSVVADDSSVTVSNGAYTLNDAAFISLQDTSVTISGGDFDVFNNAQVRILDDNSPILVSGGFLTFHDTSDIVNAFGADITTSDGGILLLDRVNVTLFESFITVTGGLFSLQDSSALLLRNSSVSLSLGTFEVLHNATARLVGSSLVISDGVAHLGYNHAGFFETDRSTVTISGGSLQISNVAQPVFSHTPVLISNGEFKGSENSTVLFDYSPVTVDGGKVIAQDNAIFTFQMSPLTVSAVTSGGGVFFQDNSIIRLQDLVSRVQVSSGTLRFDDNSVIETVPGAEFTVVGGLLEVVGQVTLNTSLITFNIKKSGASSGNALFGELSTVTLESSIINLESGLFELIIDSTLDLLNSNLTIGDGQFISSATFLGDNVNVNIGGTVTMELNHIFRLVNSRFTIGQGLTTIGGDLTSQFVIHDSVLVASGGTLRFQQVVDPEFLNVDLDVNGGAVEFTGSTDTTITNSTMDVQGDVTSSSSATVTLCNTPLTVVGGGLTVGGGSVFALCNSNNPIVIDGGSILITDTAQFNVAPGSSITVNGGGLTFSGMTFTVLRNITLGVIDNSKRDALASADVSCTIGGSSIVEFRWSEITVDGGVLQVIDQGQMFLYNSTLSVLDGEVSLEDDGGMTIAQSEIGVSGSFATSGQPNLLVTGSTIAISDGIVSFGADADPNSVRIENSEITIEEISSPSSLDFTGTVDVEINTSTLSMLSGGLNADGEAEINLKDTTIDVNGNGGLQFGGQAIMRLGNNSLLEIDTSAASAVFGENSRVELEAGSQMNMTDGEIRLTDSAWFVLEPFSTFNLLGGNFILEGNANLLVLPDTTGTISGGNLIVRGDACLVMIGSDISIEGEIEYNSTCPFRTLSDAALVVQGAPLTISSGQLNINASSSLFVINGSLIMENDAVLNNDQGNVIVSDGNIILYDYTLFHTHSMGNVLVTGGRVEVHDFATLLVEDESLFQLINNGMAGAELLVDGSGSFYVRSGSRLDVDGSGVTLLDRSFSEFQDAIIQIQGPVFVGDNGTAHVLQGTTFDVNSGGDLTVGDHAYFYVESSLITLDVGNLLVSGGGQFEATTSSQVLIDNGGSATFSDESSGVVSASSIQIRSGGGLTVEDLGVLTLNSRGTLTIDFGDILVQDTAVLEVTDFASGELRGGDIALTASGTVVISSGAEFGVSLGNVLGTDSSTVDVNNRGLLQLLKTSGGGGLLGLSGGSTLSVSTFGEVEVVGGEFNLTDSTTAILNSGRVTLVDGTLVIERNSSVVAENGATIAISGGEMLALHDTSLTVDQSLVVIRDGEFNVTHNACMLVYSAVFNQYGGSYWLQASSCMVLEDSDMRLADGQFIMTETSSLTMLRSNLKLIVPLKRSQIPTPSDPTDLQVVGGTAVVNATHSTWEISQGGIAFVDLSTITTDKTSIVIDGGRILVSDDASFLLSIQSFISVISGALEMSGSAHFVVTDSDIGTTGGDIIASNNAYFSASNADVTVVDGKFELGGDESHILDSVVLVDGSGGFTFKGTKGFLWDSAVQLLGGSFRVNGASEFDMARVSMHIDGGSFQIDGSSIASIKASTLDQLNGNVVFGGTSETDFAMNSRFVVAKGSVIIEDSAEVKVRSGATFDVAGGNFEVRDNADFLFASGSCITVTETTEGSGNLVFDGSSFARVDASCFIVEGGNAHFNDQSFVELLNKGILDIRRGSFLASDSSRVNVKSESNVLVSGGDFELFDSADVDVSSKAEVEVRLGNAIWHDSSSSTIKGSATFSVTGGNAEFRDDTSVELQENAHLLVRLGALRAMHNCQFTVTGARAKVTGGLVSFEDDSFVEFSPGADDRAELQVALGSVHIKDRSQMRFQHSDLDVAGGNVVFSEYALAAFTRADVHVTMGSMTLADSVEIAMDSSALEITGGVFLMEDRSSMHLSNSDIMVAGELSVVGSSSLFATSSQMSVQGTMSVLDSSTLQITDVHFDVMDGSLEIRNTISDTRQQTVFRNSQIEVSRSSTGSLAGGHMTIEGWVDVLFDDCSVLIDGDLTVFGQSVLTLEHTEFNIPLGSVKLDQHGRIELSRTSKLINQGYLQPPGVISFSADDAISNEGIFESSTPLDVNCGANGPAFSNSGVMSLSQAEEFQSCIDSLETTGVMELNGASVTFRQLTQAESGTTVLTNAYLDLGDAAFENAGAISGTATVAGGLENSGTIMSSSAGGHATRLAVSGAFKSRSASWVYFIINSFDLEDEEAITKITAGSIELDGAKACVCINPELEPDGDTEITVLEALTDFAGEFDQVQFGCDLCPQRRARSVQGASACDPESSYGGRDMSVVFSGCGGRNGEGGILGIEPPIYVVIPVGVGIVVLVVLVMGTVMCISERNRKKKLQKKISQRRRKKLGSMKDSISSSSADSSLSQT